MIYLVGEPNEVEAYCKKNKLKLDKTALWVFHRKHLRPDLGPQDEVVVLPSATLWVGDRLPAIERLFKVRTGRDVTYVTKKP